MRKINFFHAAPGLPFAFVIFIALLGFNCWRVSPYYNWDLVGYMGASHFYFEADPEIIHNSVFTELKEQLPEHAYRGLTEGDPYVVAIATNPDLFIRQIPFYSVKPVYPGLMLLLHSIGLDFVSASIVISKAAYIGVGFIIFVWLANHITPLWCLALASLISSFPYLIAVASFSSPDTLSTLVVLVAFYLMVEKLAFPKALLLLIAGIAIRPDNLLLLLVLAGYVFFYNSNERVWAIGCALGGISLYACISSWSDSYAWTTLFYHSFIRRIPDPANFVSGLAVADYIDIYLTEARNVSVSSEGLILLVPVNLCLLIFFYKHGTEKNLWFQALSVNILFMLAHWFLYPKEKDRMLEASYLLIMIALAISALPTFSRIWGGTQSESASGS